MTTMMIIIMIIYHLKIHPLSLLPLSLSSVFRGLIYTASLCTVTCFIRASVETARIAISDVTGYCLKDSLTSEFITAMNTNIFWDVTPYTLARVPTYLRTVSCNMATCRLDSTF